MCGARVVVHIIHSPVVLPLFWKERKGKAV